MNGGWIRKESKGGNLGQEDMCQGRAGMDKVFSGQGGERLDHKETRWLEESHESTVAWGSHSQLGRA